jgi:hypothetical protein
MNSLPTFLAFLLVALTTAVAESAGSNNPITPLSPKTSVFPPVASGREYFVALTGSDTNPGTKELPFATLEHARDEVRQLNQSHHYPAGGVTVWLRGGVYLRDHSFDLGPQDSGQAGAPVIYAAYPGETVRLVGGKIIPATAFHPVTDRAFLDRIINHAARRHLLQVDLKSLGLADYGELHAMHAVDFGSSTHYLPAPMELSIDGKAMTLARWPNRNDADPLLAIVEHAVQNMEKGEDGITNQYSSITLKDVPLKPWGSTGDGDRLALFPQQALEAHAKKWGSLDDGYVVGGLIRAYASTSQKIDKVDPKTGTIIFAAPVRVWPKYTDEAKWFYFSNIPDELDAPGEYYLDRKTGILTIYPPKSWNDQSEVVVSTLNDVLVAMESSSHIRLRGLTLENTRTSGAYIEKGEDNVLEHCVIRNSGIVGVQIGQGWDTGLQGQWMAQNPRGAKATPEIKEAGPGKPLPRLPGSYRHVLCTGMENLPVRMTNATSWDRQGGRNNGVENCTIYDTGCGGVLLGGGDRKTLTPAGNFVRNSDIYRTDRRIHMYCESVTMDGCGNIVEGNYLHDNLGGLLYFLGNDQIMQYNEIAHGLTSSKDGGVIETRQNMSMLGNKLRYNYIHDNLRSPDFNAQNCVIYLDNCTHGVEVFGNVLLRNYGRTVIPWGTSAIGITGGHDHVIANNLFIDSPGAKPGDGDDYNKTYPTLSRSTTMLRQDVDVTVPPYSTKYPEFFSTYKGVALDKDTNTPLYNRVYDNVLIGDNEGMNKSRYPDKEYRHHNVEIDTDPGFVNEAEGDYALKPDSIVYKLIPGFQPIPFDKMQRAKALRRPATFTPSVMETTSSGWIDLLADPTLAHWKHVPVGKQTKNIAQWSYDAGTGLLLCTGKGDHENLQYDREFTDGVFHCEWRLRPVEGGKGYNSGVYCRNSPDASSWHQAQVGMRTGFIFGNSTAGGNTTRFRADNHVEEMANPPGEWNTYELTAKGNTLSLWINGSVTATWDNCEVPSGQLGLEAEGWEIEFRNVKFKPAG